MPQNITDFIRDRAREDAGYALAFAVLELARVLDYSTEPTPHPLERIAIELGDIAESLAGLGR